MRAVTSINYLALNSADPDLKNDFKFMLAAAARDIRTLEFADEYLKANIHFITSAMKINHQAFNYASASLKNNPTVKEEIKRTLLNYEYINKNDSRFHVFKVHCNEESPLKEKYKNKTGDALKTAILKEFKHSLEGKTEERDALVKTFKNGREYKILCTSQGIISSIFRLQTSSAKAVEKIIEDANEMDGKNSFGNNL